MTNEDIISTVRARRDNVLSQMIQRSFPHIPIGDDHAWRRFLEFANEVYAAGSAAEREACAKFFEKQAMGLFWAKQVASTIRARGQS